MIRFAIPGDLNAPTGGYGYAREILAVWEQDGIAAEPISLPDRYPFPSAADDEISRTALASLPAPLLIDGLAYGAFSEALAREVGPRSAVLLHHPLCDETGLDQAKAAALEASERAALRHAAHVIVTSPNTAREVISRFDVAAERLTVALPGLTRAQPAPLAGVPPLILAVGSLTPRKGYGDLVRALDDVTHLDWQCRIFGSPEHDPAEAARIEVLIAECALDERITLEGAASHDAVWQAYADADLFVTSSYHEGYGMAVAEAAAHGLPILATKAGALQETVPPARFVGVGDVVALAEGLADLLSSQTDRRALGAACQIYARTLPDWSATAQLIAATLGEIG